MLTPGLYCRQKDFELTMSEPTITCPKCGTPVKLTESLAAPLVDQLRQQYERKLAAKDADVLQRETAVRQQTEKLATEKQAMADAIAAQIKIERQKIVAEESARLKLMAASDLEQRTREMAELREVLKQRDEKLAEAQKRQADAMRKERELDDARREMEVTIEKRIAESLVSARDLAKKEADEQSRAKVREKEMIIQSMQTKIEELSRKAEQGSQQLQGEVLEVELEETLRSEFKFDTIEPVGKGEFGGDILHRVIGPAGQMCGTILWESKRTKNWSDGWLPKLRDDQRAAKADVAAIVSQALPKNVHTLDLVDNVWIVEPRCVVPIAVVLRQMLIELSSARKAIDGQQTKMELVYQYLVGPRFRQRIEAIVEKFRDMREDLDKERKGMTRLWAKREEQMRCVLESTSGLYGDLQGIAGRTLAEIDGLSLEALEGPNGES
jgi:hypothetical protein